MTEKQARSIRAVLVEGSDYLDDKTVSTAPESCRRMRYDGSLIQNGTRINWGGKIKRAAVDLYDREDQNPDNSPNLWEDLEYKDGIRIIPDVITVGKAFSKDELGWWKDLVYRSKVDNNVYTPDQYAPNWEKVSTN